MSFKRLDPEDISISAESVVAPLWSTDVVELTRFYTSSTQVASSAGKFFFEVFHENPTGSDGRVQYALAYGHKEGKGTLDYNSSVGGKSPSSTVYGQFRNLVYGDEETDFTFVGDNTSDFIYGIVLERSRYKEKLLPGSFELTLNHSGNVLHLIDNSQQISTVSFADSGRIYEIVSGSGTTVHTGLNANGYTSAGASYGKFLPDIGVIILNGAALDSSAGLGTDFGVHTSNNDDKNLDRFHNAITVGGSFKIQSEETISSNFVFVRIRNSEFNYSTNPSNITGSGELRHDVMINSPQAYLTTVGLYNDSNDLLAIAKLSRPLLKDFTKEALLRIKLDY